MDSYFIVRVPVTATVAEIEAVFAPLGVEVVDISGEAEYIGQIDRLYNVENDYEEADEIRTGVGDDLYDAFSALVPGGFGHAS